MAISGSRAHRRYIHPLHAVLLAGALPLFFGALLADWAYASSYQIQWTNFASWLIAGGLVFMGFALLWAAVEVLGRRRYRTRGGWLHLALVALTFLLGFINALVHAKDVWAKMPEGLVLSVIVFLLALAATWGGFSRQRVEEAP